MKASWNWLRSLVPDLRVSAQEAAERLTLSGLEVEAIVPFGRGLEPVVVARVVAVEPHPTRGGLRLVTVDRGGAQQQVVCGAPNVPPPGGLVVLAPLGTTLPAAGGGGLTIAAREIGGVRSEGMLCSESELGIGHGADGIIVLHEGAADAGEPFLSAMPSASDVIFEINVTPNRPDALGHFGIARDLSALYRIGLVAPRFEAPVWAGGDGNDIDVLVEATERCTSYGAAELDDVTVRPSPAWVRHRLHSLGVRPISNVVDVTNLLMLLYGQPTHAFDRDKLRGGKVRIRQARPGEMLTTLDGEARALDTDDLVIADAEGPIALAGVMGGSSSEVTAATKRVLLECAHFEARGVRRAARRHGMHTEASHRYERGTDPLAVPRVMTHAAALFSELAGSRAKTASNRSTATLAPPGVVRLRSARLDALLGIPTPWEEAIVILGHLGCDLARRESEGVATFRVPSWRPDIEREADLIDEVMRIRGVDGIPSVLPPIRPQEPTTAGKIDSATRAAAIALGMSEALTYAFVSPRALEALSAPTPTVSLKHPLTEERSVMRTSLLPGLLEAVARARRHGERSARLFTLGRLFQAPTDATKPLPREERAFAAVLAGPRPAYLARADEHDIYDAKAIAIEVIERVSGYEASLRQLEGSNVPAHLHPRGTAIVEAEGKRIGVLGPLHPDVVDALDLGGAALVVELDLDALAALGVRVPKVEILPRLPVVVRDVAFVVRDEFVSGAVAEMIHEAAGELCAGVEVFDVFRGGAVPEGHRSLAFHVIYRDPRDARTLTDAEVDTRNELVRAAVEQRLGGVLRALATAVAWSFRA